MTKKFDLILAIETSCDDTSVALVKAESGSTSVPVACRVLSMLSRNQDDIHAPFGGVIPELACRNHTMRILPLLDSLLGGRSVAEPPVAWKDIDGIAVTCKPGLIGALLVGVTVAKTLSSLHDIPLIGVNHLEGHLHAPFLHDETYSPPENFGYPFVGLCVSGGHTSLYEVKGLGKYKLLGRTLDDAAGEAFDKFGKLLDLGYPAGAKVDNLAKQGNRSAHAFPRALKQKTDLNFSFSGLKTAGLLEIKKTEWKGNPQVIADLCASFQEAIVEVLINKLNRALKMTGLKSAVITGGVSANSRLRQAAKEILEARGVTVAIPPLRYCTDNAAMIGLVGLLRFRRGEKDSLTLAPEAYMKVAELV